MSKQEFRLPFSGQVKQHVAVSPAGINASSFSLIDPKYVAANQGGELTAEQRRKFKSMLPGLTIVVFPRLLAFCITGFLTLVLADTIISKVLRNWQSPAKALASIANTSSVILIIFAIFALATAIAAFLFFYSLLGYVRARSILKPGAIRRAEGTVLWSGRKYVASFPGNKVPLQTWNDCEIDVVIPGRHQFFYLPVEKTYWLLSIERYPPDHEALLDLFRSLAQANGFHTDALESNRRGLLSQNQLRGSNVGNSTGIAAGRVQMIEGAAQKIAEKKISAPKIKRIMADAAFDLAAGLIFDVVLGSNTDSSNSSSDDDEGEIDIIACNYACEIQNMRFGVSERGYDALVEGVHYRAYYLPHSEVLVNIEPLFYSTS